MRIEQLQNGLRDAIVTESRRLIIPAYDVRDDLERMTDADMIRHHATTGRIVVWSGGSDHTIFGDCKVNWLFRAWHDYCHIISGVCNHSHHLSLGCFDPIAEYAVADFNCKGLGTSLAQVVQCEVSGQARHFATTGKFVADQVQFTLDSLRI